AEVARHGGREGATLEQMLLARTAELSPTVRRLLELVAVAGGPVEPRVLLGGVPANQDGIAALAVLRAARLIRAAGAGDRIETYHDRIRETVTANMHRAPLRECHETLARLLEADGSADPEILAVHLHAAGELARAGHYAAAAARAAAEALAFDRAARLYRLALDLVPPRDAARAGLQIALATSLANAGRGAEAAPQYLTAAEAAQGAREALD